MAADTHKRISNEKEKLGIKYNSSIEYHNNSEKEIKESFIKVLENYVKIDLKRGITHKGPHRDDILFFINGTEVKTYSSQGQQRTTLLSLKISELKYMKEETGELPVLLLDDVFSELDKERQRHLIEFIKDMQTIITCTNVEYLESLINEEAKIFKVEGGMIEKE